MFSGEGHPLRQGRLESYDVELGDGEVNPQVGVSAEIELGVIARNYFVEKFDPESWLENPVHGGANSIRIPLSGWGWTFRPRRTRR